MDSIYQHKRGGDENKDLKKYKMKLLVLKVTAMAAVRFTRRVGGNSGVNAAGKSIRGVEDRPGEVTGTWHGKTTMQNVEGNNSPQGRGEERA